MFYERQLHSVKCDHTEDKLPKTNLDKTIKVSKDFFFIAGVLAIWPTGALCRGAGGTWERTTGSSSLPVLSSVFIRSTQMKTGSTPVLNPQFKYSLIIIIVYCLFTLLFICLKMFSIL